MLEGILQPELNLAIAADGVRDIQEVVVSHAVAVQSAIRKQIGMVESVKQLQAERYGLALQEFKRSLHAGVVEHLSRTIESIPADVAVLTRNDHVTKVILCGSKVSSSGIKTEGRVEVHKRGSVEAEADSGVAGTVWIQASRAVVDWYCRVTQTWPIASAVAVAVVGKTRINAAVHQDVKKLGIGAGVSQTSTTGSRYAVSTRSRIKGMSGCRFPVVI